MKCETCGQTKDDYHFFKHRNRYDREFFLNIQPETDICWECAGPYRCIGCGEIKDASEFRVCGRLCADCKEVGIVNSSHLDASRKGGTSYPTSQDEVETPEIAVFEVAE